MPVFSTRVQNHMSKYTIAKSIIYLDHFTVRTVS